MISVIIPVYNTEKYLKRCIESFLNQTYKDFEIILVDDGSEDSSGRICDEYAEKYDFIKVIHKENGGLTSARLAGYKVAKGDFVCFPDSDDYAEPDYLETLINAFDDNTDIVIGSYFIDNININIIKKKFTNKSVQKYDFINTMIIPNIDEGFDFEYVDFVWLRLYRKSVITEDCFVSEREVYTEDLFFNWYALKNTKQVKIIDSPVYHYVKNEGSLTLKYRPSMREMLKNRYNLIKKYCENENIAVEKERFVRLKLSDIYLCVFNAKNAKSLNIFISECKEIRKENNSYFKSFVGLSKKEKLIITLLKFRLYYFLYFIYCKLT